SNSRSSISVVCRRGRSSRGGFRRVLAGRAGRFVVFVAGEAGRPVVGAGGFGFEVCGAVFAVGFDFVDDRARDFGFALFIREQLEGDFAFASRFDHAGDRGGVFCIFALVHLRGAFGGDFRAGRFYQRALAGVLAGLFPYTTLFRSGEAGRPVVGAGGFGFEVCGAVFAVGFDFVDDRARDFGFALFIREQ